MFFKIYTVYTHAFLKEMLLIIHTQRPVDPGPTPARCGCQNLSGLPTGDTLEVAADNRGRH